jgi:hypothetical protein
MSQFQKHPTIVDAEFRPGECSGSWKLIDSEGKELFLSDFTFRQLYFPVGKDKCKFCKHERRHKTSYAVCDRHEMCLFTWKERNDEG